MAFRHQVLEWDAVNAKPVYGKLLLGNGEGCLLIQWTAHVETGAQLPRELFDQNDCRLKKLSSRYAKPYATKLSFHYRYAPYNGLIFGAMLKLHCIRCIWVKIPRRQLAVLRPTKMEPFPNSLAIIFAGGLSLAASQLTNCRMLSSRCLRLIWRAWRICLIKLAVAFRIDSVAKVRLDCNGVV